MQFETALNKVKDKLFSKIHLNNLVYNTCWEDPRLDRKLMNLTNNSKLLMITSAGCNALDYLLDNPKTIDCVDVNPRQNALLELKKAGIKTLAFQDFFKLFGEGAHPQFKEIYTKHLRPELPDYAQTFWDKKIKYFNPKSKKKSFYFRGTSGQFAWLFKRYFDANKKAKTAALEILEAKSEKEQRAIFKQLEPYIMNRFVKWLMNRHVTMSLLGVPRPQRDLITNNYPGGMVGYLSDNLRHIFTELPIQDNYFWRLYITGKYTRDCCPNYLKQENFEVLKTRIQNLHTHNSTISNFLKQKGEQFSHFILLDHQDWLAAHDVQALEEEWRLIFKYAQPAGKVLMRSASTEIDFFPDFVHSKLKFDQKLANECHNQDRVGTYGSTYFGSISTNKKALKEKGLLENEKPSLALA